MTQPSRGAAVFLTLFALPFLGAGLFFAFALLTQSPSLHTSSTITGVVVSTVFVFVGGGLIYAAIGGYGRLKKQRAIEESSPQSPWLWRADWATRRAQSENKNSEIGSWILAILCNLITLPFLFGIVPDLLLHRDPRVLLILGFNLVGLILLVNAVRATVRHRRFGDTYFEFDSLPFTLGERVGGRINLALDTRAEHGVDLRLSCVRKVITGSGKNSTTNNIVLWQADQNVPAGAVGPGPMGRAIPVDFSIPADSPITNHDNPRDQILWQLHAQADVPGIDYKDDFELPVFRGAASSETVRDSESPAFSDANAFGFATTRSDDSGAVAPPAHAKVVVSNGSGGTEFYFPALRNPSRAVILLLVTIFWSGLVYFLYHSHAPIFFFIVFGLSDLLLIGGFLHVTFGSARITAGSGQIVSCKGVFGAGKTRRIQIADVASIVPVVSMQQGTSGGNQLYSIRLILKDGRKLTLADEIDSRQEARWVVSQIETLTGLKLDTHVEVDLPLGVSPQPGSQTAGPIFTSPGRTTSTAASLAVFAVLVSGMMGFMVWRMTSFTSRTNKSRTAAAAAAAKSVPRRVFSGPLTDADVERVRALPAQAQAEELLERAIGHDALALKVFGQQLPDWIGHIRMTDRMKQLEQRSRFSNDLRVRYANADISLALDGWQENEQAAGLLIERARTDQQYRAAALYFLGMLAGRGVDYDRIHGVLLNYARNDKDVTARQWAVEGMRFLGKDEVLDELFISFTEDPSPIVRERAGCNLSDCGMFTRKQRMRMVPQFIDLALNPRTTVQMRNWSFMALREITDENVSADAVAWSRWYQDHAAEKMAQFERLDWWQVRGDE